MPISTIGSNSLNQTSDLTINGQTVGKGGGNVATNTAHGVSALQANTSGSNNVAVGYRALSSMATGNTCVAVGQDALKVSVAGTENTAVGFQSMAATLTASGNSALGLNSLSNNTTGNNNVAVGYAALTANTTASYGTAIGYQAGYSAVTADYNTFVGYYAGRSTTGDQNTFLGKFAGNAITTGSQHTIIGAYNGNQGGLDIRTSSNYVVLSDGGGTPRIYVNGAGSMYAPGVYNTTAGVSANLYVDSSGLFYRATSSLKYKTNIENATHGLADVLKLRPITYEGKAEVDAGKTYGGLIAEEVHEAGLTEFVQYADDGSPDAIHYGNMVSLAFKAIQELKTIVDAQAAEIAELKAKVA